MTVVQPWVSNLPFKQQTLLLSAIRGPDGVGKTNKVKNVLKYYRATVLKNADALSGFMDQKEPTVKTMNKFVRDIEEYPLHWVMHFYRAVAIISNRGTHGQEGFFWIMLYQSLAKRL